MSVNRKLIIDSMSKVQVQANADGLIPAFGVLVNQLPAAVWNNFADLLVSSVSGDLQEAAEFLLMNAANECGYHTGYGIITSEEWKAIVAPTMEGTAENVLHGAFAVFSAWGWGRTEIEELVPGERMVVRAYDYYESDVVDQGADTRMTAHMIRGVCSAFMDLAYGKPYPAGFRTFTCEQVKGLERGDDYGEFVVTKA
jgi:hypothetical protein